MFVACVMAEDARERAPAARVRLRAGERPVGRTRAAVCADVNEGRTEGRAQIVFGHHEIDRAGLRLVSDDEIEERVERVFALRCGDLREAFALPLFKLAIDDRADQYARCAAATQVDVLPL